MSVADLKNLTSSELLLKLCPGPERGGVILEDGTIVEVDNRADDPLEGYYPDVEQLIPHLDKVAGTWHTHPDASANLSVEDAETYAAWPQCIHAIVGIDGLRWYAVKNGAAVNF